VVLTSPRPLAADAPAVVTLTCAPHAQRLRVNSTVVDSAREKLAKSPLNQMLIGWGFLNHYPKDGFGGRVYSVVAGKGAPTDDELGVLERYLASTAGVTL
jgi:hypothetical protein